MSRNYDDSRDQSNKDFDKQLEIDNAVEKEAKRNEGLPENTYFIDGIFLPVKIVPINNTEKCCRKCRGSGDTCDNGGSFVYCIVLNHYAMQDSGLDVSGGSNVGCNNFRPLEEHPSTIQSEVENIAGEVYKNLVDGNVKDFAISHFKTGFTHPQKPSGEWYSKGDMEDLLNKLNCLNGYLKSWQRGGKIPNELSAVIIECDEYLGFNNPTP